jgi:glutamate-1-semialdehyde 2,1-aminomutase
MWTGFRLALGGAQEYFGVQADLVCYSKAIANGMPISVLAGRKDIMKLCDRDVFFFTTFGGEALSLAAAMATIRELRDKRVPAYLAERGKEIREGYNAVAKSLGMDYTSCTGFDCRTIVAFAPSAGNPLEMKSFVQQELLRRGILWGGFHNMCYSHSREDVHYTVSAYQEVLPLLKHAVEEGTVRTALKGEPVEPVFRKTSHFNVKPKSRVAPKEN